MEVNLESYNDMVCGPPTMTRETMQFIRLQIKWVMMNVHSNEFDAPFQ